MSTPEPYIDASEAARFLRRTPKDVQRLARRKVLPAYATRTSTTRTKWLFRISELDKWVFEQQNVERHQRSH